MQGWFCGCSLIFRHAFRSQLREKIFKSYVSETPTPTVTTDIFSSRDTAGIKRHPAVKERRKVCILTKQEMKYEVYQYA